MNVGLGLPITDPSLLLEWGRRADAGPFTTLGLLDRLVYDNPEPLVTLAAIAGVTSRIRVQTEVLLAPLRQPALLAKQAATLDRLSSGRFTLGIGLGGRDDDYLAAGIDPRGRGRRLDELMARMRSIWSGEPGGDGVGTIGPAPGRPGGPEVLFGAFAQAAIERVARFGDGVLGAGRVKDADRLFRAVEHAWREHGRAGRPRLVAQVNAALGPRGVIDGARTAVADYYGFLGPHQSSEVANQMLITPGQVRDALATLAGVGADEVVLYCWSGDVDQVDRLADVVT